MNLEDGSECAKATAYKHPENDLDISSISDWQYIVSDCSAEVTNTPTTPNMTLTSGIHDKCNNIHTMFC